jgi:glucosamine--fructose-6-phosphate aminotransferase (isomerizing)
MCGIFGFIGKEVELSLLIEGLSRLEYRGYDSCGLAGRGGRKFFLKKQQGKIHQLKENIKSILGEKLTSCILHTRWATHGEPSKVNAHPHTDCRKNIALVHNGIIENYHLLKKELLQEGHRFLSDTDTEVIAHLIEKFYSRSLEEAVCKAVKKLKGAFALGIISKREPYKLVGVRKGSPLIVGLGEKGYFLASDIPALLPFAKRVVYLKDEEWVVLSKESMEVFNFHKEKCRYQIEEVKMDAEDAEKKNYQHFMLKEILEQPFCLERILSLYCKSRKHVGLRNRSLINFPNVTFKENYLKKLNKVYITACGTAYHAGLIGKYFLEKYSCVNAEIDVSSELRYRSINFNKDSLLVAISQSGETADTLAAVKEAKEKGVKILSICNVLGSSLIKESGSFIYTLAGPEIGVASTKAYTAQIVSLLLFSLYVGSLKGALPKKELRAVLKELEKIPDYQRKILASRRDIERVSQKFSRYGCFLFLGRGINYPSALEGALKLKEISYIPAEGYPAGEMKHGPIALIDEYRAVVCIAPRDKLYGKMVSNIQEIKARKGKVLGILNHRDNEASLLSDEAIYIPELKNQDLSPLLAGVVLQLFAYFVAKNLGCEIDQPRNLAKSVTVE